MSFNLEQLLKGSARDLLLRQVAKQFGLSSETGGNLLNKGLSMVLGGMTQQATHIEGAKGLFNLIKDSPIQGNPLELLGNTENGSLLDMGQKLLPSLFGERTDAVVQHLADSTNTTPVAAKGLLGMLLPTVFSFFKGKILSGLGLGAFAGLLGEQTKALSSHLDSKALSALGFAGGSLGDVLGKLGQVGGVAAAATAAVKTATSATASTATEQVKKSSGWGKWLLAGLVALAAFFGIKNCTPNKTETAAPTTAQTAPTAPQSNESEAAQLSDGLGNLGWAKSENDFTLSGTVQNEGVKADLLNAFKGLAGNLALVDKLVVDPNAAKFGFNNFNGLTDLLKDYPNVTGAFSDKVLNLVGNVTGEEAKANLATQAKALLGEVFTVNTDEVAVNVPEAKLVEGLGNLGWQKTEKDLTVSGTVQNEGIKGAILNAFKGLAGELPLVDNVQVDANAEQFSFNNFGGLASLVKAFPNVSGAFADKAVNLVGEVANLDAKSALIEQAKTLLGETFSINADGVKIAEAVVENTAQEPAPIADMSASKLDLEIVFDTGSSEISPRYYNRLNAFAKFLIENGRRGEIAGYTDNVGNAASNQKLSEKRANAVREYLVKQGVPSEALTAVGYGPENPIADNNTAEGRNKNRRIEFNAR